MAKDQKTVGVIGGLGPEATLDFFAKVLARTSAKTDQDHLHLIINNNPKIPNRNEAIAGTGPSPGPALAESAKALELAGADFLVMVCNTAHAFQADIEATVTIPFISMIDAVVDYVFKRYPKNKQVGVLATTGCLNAGLYQNAFAKHQIDTLILVDDLRETFMQLLYQIKAGRKDEVKVQMKSLAQTLIEQGADLIISGCTEVPLVLFQSDLAVPLINSTDVLIERVIELV